MTANPMRIVLQKARRNRERKKFETWMRKYWGGISLNAIYHGRDHFEYREVAAQTAWEVWRRFSEMEAA